MERLRSLTRTITTAVERVVDASREIKPNIRVWNAVWQLIPGSENSTSFSALATTTVPGAVNWLLDFNMDEKGEPVAYLNPYQQDESPHRRNPGNYIKFGLNQPAEVLQGRALTLHSDLPPFTSITE